MEKYLPRSLDGTKLATQSTMAGVPTCTLICAKQKQKIINIWAAFVSIPINGIKNIKANHIF